MKQFLVFAALALASGIMPKVFVFVGPEGYPFPSDAEEHFKERFKTYWSELYAEGRKR